MNSKREGLGSHPRIYLPEDDSNDERFTRDGWYRTDDIAHVSRSGVVEILDRKRDMIKSGGEWISSLELERALGEHPKIADVAVIGVPHPEWGERPMALVVPVNQAHLTASEVLAFLEERIPSWWRPDVVEIVSELPRTSVGKHNKRAMRELYASRLQAAGEGRTE